MKDRTSSPAPIATVTAEAIWAIVKTLNALVLRTPLKESSDDPSTGAMASFPLLQIGAVLRASTQPSAATTPNPSTLVSSAACSMRGTLAGAILCTTARNSRANRSPHSAPSPPSHTPSASACRASRA
jgi:hypothetical protein